MIEVEKKFQPTVDQIKALTSGAEFMGAVVLEDTYYDYSDYRLLKKGVRLRNRNGEFELKIGKSNGVAEEIETDEEIQQYFSTSKSLNEFIDSELEPIIRYKTERQKYQKEGFSIDIDKLDFGFSVCEVELLVNTEEEIRVAEERILNFVTQYNLEIKDLPSKRGEYLRLFKSEVYKEIYGK